MGSTPTALPPFDAYEVHPCVSLGHDDEGREIYEACDEVEPEITIWSVYGHRPGFGLESLSDHGTQNEAETERERLESTLIQQPEDVPAPRARPSL